MKYYTYYNEWDKPTAAWLRELIKMGLIMDGEVDERNIIEVQASELAGFTRKHFFAGIGGWEFALQLAGWPEDRPVTTASLPCQPFSAAGKGKGKDDKRHLLPHFIELVKQCNWRTIIGEQVPGAIKHGWLDDLQAHLGMEGYAVGSAVLTAAGQGAPNIRQRLYWVANSDNEGLQRRGGFEQKPVQEGWAGKERHDCEGGAIDGVGNTQHNGHDANTLRRSLGAGKTEGGMQQPERPSSDYTDCDWVYCRDGKYRPIKPSIKPLAHGLPRGMVHSGDQSAPINADETQEARVMRLKGYGNAITPAVAAEFIKVFMEVENA
jgi:DNA (cytosine-5)-methyltransferase 1